MRVPPDVLIESGVTPEYVICDDSPRSIVMNNRKTESSFKRRLTPHRRFLNNLPLSPRLQNSNCKAAPLQIAIKTPTTSRKSRQRSTKMLYVIFHAAFSSYPRHIHRCISYTRVCSKSRAYTNKVNLRTQIGSKRGCMHHGVQGDCRPSHKLPARSSEKIDRKHSKTSF